ncbi:MAG: hypothetical protein QE263_08130 [Vampirovibrionales bacterium]|nr:hypothetical protein [Vampirovibrionales bacterium]
MGFNAVQPAVAMPRFGFKQVGIFRVFDELFPEDYFKKKEGKALLTELEAHCDDFAKTDEVVINVGMKPAGARGESPRLTAMLTVGKHWKKKLIESRSGFGKALEAWLGHGDIIERAIQKAHKQVRAQQVKAAIEQRWG